MIKIKSTNTILYCKNWNETVSFYKKLLNRPVLISLDWFIEFKISDSSRLSIADETRSSIDSSHGKGITITFEVADIQTTHTYLIDSGFNPSPIKNHSWGAQIIHINDPEGHRIEFWASGV